MNLHDVIRSVLHSNNYSPYELRIRRTVSGDVSVGVYDRSNGCVGSCMFGKRDWRCMLLNQPIEYIFQGE